MNPIDLINQEADDLHNDDNDDNHNNPGSFCKNGMFTIMHGNDWLQQASQKPESQMLFDDFWFEQELCILFAGTNTGKSILAVQIADAISRGVPAPGFKLGAAAQPVIYFDFELSDKQFEARYSKDYKDHYSFHPNFFRAEINTGVDIPESFADFDDYLTHCIEQVVINSGAKVLIVDNISYLRTETERSRDAGPLMKQLNMLKRKYYLSVLVLAHTPKRDASRPMTTNDLKGSSSLMNHCDSSFCIGQCHSDKRMRYLKQIKARAAEKRYEGPEVLTCIVEKPHNFLRFAWHGISFERDHLREPVSDTNQRDRDFLISEVKRLSGEGKTQREIAEELGLSVGTVNIYLKK